MLEGEGTLDHAGGEMATFRAAAEPGLARVEVTVTQGDVVCKAEAQITVAASLLPKASGSDSTYQGLPGYTFHKAAGELWRSRFDAERNLVVINNGHRDFVYAARSKMLKLRYICRLFAKELVLKNFIGIPPGSTAGALAGADLVHRGEFALACRYASGGVAGIGQRARS